MRNPLRLVTSAVLGTALLLSLGVGSTFAAGHSVVKEDLADAWCFYDTIDTYCNVQKGTFTIETKKDGTEVGKLEMTLKTDVTHDGVFVATSTTKSKMETRFGADGSYSFSSHDKVRWTDGEETCKTDIRIKIVDFDVLVDTYKTHCD